MESNLFWSKIKRGKKGMTKYYIFLNLTVFGELKSDLTYLLILADSYWRLEFYVL